MTDVKPASPPITYHLSPITRYWSGDIRNLAITLVAGIVVAVSVPVHARITRIEIERVESPAFGGASFGKAGPYEKLVGRAHGELDPRDELNRGIVYIDKAPLNAAGRVEYSMDVLIIKPVTVSRGNRTVLYDVVNRGDTRAFAVFNVGASPLSDPKTEKDLGDGFLLKQGYTVVASGWQGDVLGSTRLKAQVPAATDPGGKPITDGRLGLDVVRILEASGDSLRQQDFLR